jgi:hypothetical protein
MTKAKMGKGITNKQAKYLGALCRELRLKYPGNGMSRVEASDAIETLEQRVQAKREATRRRFAG